MVTRDFVTRLNLVNNKQTVEYFCAAMYANAYFKKFWNRVNEVCESITKWINKEVT